MIVLDTHIWVWWVHGHERLTPDHLSQLEAFESDGLGVSVISCWEVAKLVELGRLELPRTLEDWMRRALAYPGIELLPQPHYRYRAHCHIIVCCALHSGKPRTSSFLPEIGPVFG